MPPGVVSEDCSGVAHRSRCVRCGTIRPMRLSWHAPWILYLLLCVVGGLLAQERRVADRTIVAKRSDLEQAEQAIALARSSANTAEQARLLHMQRRLSQLRALTRVGERLVCHS